MSSGLRLSKQDLESCYWSCDITAAFHWLRSNVQVNQINAAAELSLDLLNGTQFQCRHVTLDLLGNSVTSATAECAPFCSHLASVCHVIVGSETSFSFNYADL